MSGITPYRTLHDISRALPTLTIQSKIRDARGRRRSAVSARRSATG